MDEGDLAESDQDETLGFRVGARDLEETPNHRQNEPHHIRAGELSGSSFQAFHDFAPFTVDKPR